MAEVDAVLGKLSAGEEPESERWRTGFYFNSAIIRMTFCAERALQVIDPPLRSGRKGKGRRLAALATDALEADIIDKADFDKLDDIRNDVNSIKHDLIDLDKRKVRSLAEAQDVLPLLVRLVARAQAKATDGP